MKQTKLSYSKLNIMFHECNRSIISSKKTLALTEYMLLWSIYVHN